MTSYRWMYRLGLTPWERYARAAGPDIEARIANVGAGRDTPPGRALDLGCGRGIHTARLARHGWDAVGIDLVPDAIAAAREQSGDGVRYVVGDVTTLPMSGLGTFELFLDIGCFQGLKPQQRSAMGAGVTALAAPGAELLMLAFGPSPMRRLVEGVSRTQVMAAFPEWQLLQVSDAPVAGLGWPMNRTAPQWYHLRLGIPDTASPSR